MLFAPISQTKCRTFFEQYEFDILLQLHLPFAEQFLYKCKGAFALVL